jgi:hypothetical protein
MKGSCKQRAEIANAALPTDENLSQSCQVILHTMFIKHPGGRPTLSELMTFSWSSKWAYGMTSSGDGFTARLLRRLTGKTLTATHPSGRLCHTSAFRDYHNTDI